MPMLMPVFFPKSVGGLTIFFAHAYAKTRVSLGGGLWLPLPPYSSLLEERGGLPYALA